MHLNIAPIQKMACTFVFMGAVLSLGCTESTDLAKAKDKRPPTTPADIDPRSTVIGVVPIESTKEIVPTATATKSDLSKAQQSKAMPLPGQANDHSTLSPKASQKSTPPVR